MLKNYIIHKPLIPSDTLAHLALCLHKIIFSLGSVFQSFWKKFILSKKCDIFFIFDGCLQPCSLVNVLKAYIR